MLAPLLAALAGVLVSVVFSAGYTGGPLDFATGSLTQLLVQLVKTFALAVSIVIADGAWRYGHASFENAWDEARRKAPDILLAALGFMFVLWAAGALGGVLGSGVGLALTVVALFFFIYTLPAAAIGGIPGGAALQISFERARSNVPTTLLVAAVYIITFIGVPIVSAYLSVPVLLAGGSSLVESLIAALVQAVFSGYFALVLAKVYNDISYGRRY